MRISDWSSDVCSSDLILGKPGNIEQAHAQLRACAGREVRFLTAVALVHGEQVLDALDVTTVRFRQLCDEEIGRAHAELQSLMRISYAVFCLKKKKKKQKQIKKIHNTKKSHATQHRNKKTNNQINRYK